MSWEIQIHRAKPNPRGKDVNQYGIPKPEQLLGEWVDLKNVGNESVRLSTLHLCHTEFSQGCVPNENPSTYWNGSYSHILKPSEIVRVHTGKSTDAYLMANEDKGGVHVHEYAERGSFVLNNKCGDVLSVWWKDEDGKWHKEDKTGYEPNPPEGAVLVRVGPTLVSSTFGAFQV